MKRFPAFQTLALTGGTGAGKGCAAAILREYGVPVLDTDIVSRIVYEVGQPCLSELAEAFGGDILRTDGSLDRAALAQKVFGEPDDAERARKLGTLNRLAHRYILAYCRDWLSEQKAAGYKAACIDAPQLFESGFEGECDYIIAVTAEQETRIARIIARDGITREKALDRIRAQHDDAFFTASCHTVLTNNGTPDDLRPQVEAVLRARGLLS